MFIFDIYFSRIPNCIHIDGGRNLRVLCYFDPIQSFFENKIFYLFVQNTYSVMSNDVLISVPLFLFMGYMVERANILDRLFLSLQVGLRGLPGSMA